MGKHIVKSPPFGEGLREGELCSGMEGRRPCSELNPFYIKDDEGKYMVFGNYKEIYLYVLKEIRMFCPKGYIDFPVILNRLTKWDSSACMSFNNVAMAVSAVLREDCIMVDWKNIQRYRDVFKDIMKALHEISSTKFDALEYDIAWDKFVIFNSTHRQ